MEKIKKIENKKDNSLKIIQSRAEKNKGQRVNMKLKN